MAQAPSQPEGTTAAQETGRRSGHHGFPQRTRGLPQDKPGPQQNRFSREGSAEVVQEYDDEDEHISVMRDMGQQSMQPVEHREFLLWCWQGCSGARSGCLEREGEERGHAKKAECHEIIPRKFLLQKEDGESNEDGDNDALLNDLERKTREMD